MSDYISRSAILENLDRFGSSPPALQSSVLKALRQVGNGEMEQTSPQNPLVFLLEVSAFQTAAFIGKDYLLNRRQYPTAAQTPEDLYYHMSDKDYIGAWASPATHPFSISFQYNDLLSMMVPMPDGTGDKLTIPKGMSITVGGVDFTLEYPIDIVRRPHGVFNITYNTTEVSPIHPLTTNLVPYNIATLDGLQRLVFEVEFVQCKVTVIEKDITMNQHITLTKAFKDQFFWCKVFTGSEASGWKELEVTHCPDVYNLSVPTAVARVTGQDLNIQIPPVYNKFSQTQQGAFLSNLGSRMRVVIYSTMGAIQMNMPQYGYSLYKSDWFPEGSERRDYTKLGSFSERLKDVKTTTIFSRHMLDGGRDGLTFEQLKQRVINNTTGPNIVPISNVAMENKNFDNGFSIIRTIDLAPRRVYWATKPLPTPGEALTQALQNNRRLVTSAAASIESVSTSISELVSSGNVRDNGARVTISPTTIYNSKNGITQIISKSEIDRIMALPVEQQAKIVNDNNFMFTPFHYVVDTGVDAVSLRPYYLDSPTAYEKSYVNSNHRINPNCTIREYALVKGNNGYELSIIVEGNQDFQDLEEQEVFSQLSFEIPNDNTIAHIKGELLSKTQKKEFVFQFKIDTNYDVDDQHGLILTSAKVTNNDPMRVAIALLGKVKIVIGKYGTLANWSPIDEDSALAHFMLEPDAKVIVAESMTLKFGDHLKYLWERSRSEASEMAYKRYLADVPMVYEADVYEADPVSGSIINIDPQGKPVYNLIHKKGDTVKDKDGNVRYAHRKDDVVKDEYGKPVIDEPRRLLRRLELMLVDGCYWFATDDAVVNYREFLVETFLSWMTKDLKEVNEVSLDQTDVMYYPQSTMGSIKVMYDDGVVSYFQAEQSLKVKLAVSKTVAENADVIEKIKIATVDVINEELKKQTVSTSSIIDGLRDVYGTDVLGVSISGLGGSKNVTTFSSVDETKRTTLKKKLVVLADNKTSIEEDVTFDIMSHDLENVK